MIFIIIVIIDNNRYVRGSVNRVLDGQSSWNDGSFYLSNNANYNYAEDSTKDYLYSQYNSLWCTTIPGSVFNRTEDIPNAYRWSNIVNIDTGEEYDVEQTVYSNTYGLPAGAQNVYSYNLYASQAMYIPDASFLNTQQLWPNSSTEGIYFYNTSGAEGEYSYLGSSQLRIMLYVTSTTDMYDATITYSIDGSATYVVDKATGIFTNVQLGYDSTASYQSPAYLKYNLSDPNDMPQQINVMVAKIGGRNSQPGIESYSTIPQTFTEYTKVVPSSLPSQSGNAGKFLTTNGSAASWGNAMALPDGYVPSTITAGVGVGNPMAGFGLVTQSVSGWRGDKGGFKIIKSNTNGSGCIIELLDSNGAPYRFYLEVAKGFYSDGSGNDFLRNLGTTTYPWNTIYVTKINNGSDITVPNQAGTIVVATPPSADGTYVLKATVSDGTVTYTWVAE